MVIHSDINGRNKRHSPESGTPEKHWIPGQARNDRLHKIYIVMYNSSGYKNRNILTPFSKFN